MRQHSVTNETLFTLASLAVERAWLPRTAKLRFGFSSSTRRQGRNSNNESDCKRSQAKLTNNSAKAWISKNSFGIAISNEFLERQGLVPLREMWVKIQYS